MKDRPLLKRGYISLSDAADEIVRRRFGDPKEIPWVEAEPMLFQGKTGIEESRNVMRLDEAAVAAGRRQMTVARRALRRALAAGRLIAEVDECTIPTDYWHFNPWRGTTLHIGTFETGDFAEETARPVGILQKEFRRWFSRAVHVKTAPLPLIRARLEEACREMVGAIAPNIRAHVKAVLEAEGKRVPKRWLEEAWRQVDPSVKPRRGRPINSFNNSTH
jgi:hypothetical protein